MRHVGAGGGSDARARQAQVRSSPAAATMLLLGADAFTAASGAPGGSATAAHSSRSDLAPGNLGVPAANSAAQQVAHALDGRARTVRQATVFRRPVAILHSRLRYQGRHGTIDPQLSEAEEEKDHGKFLQFR